MKDFRFYIVLCLVCFWQAGRIPCLAQRWEYLQSDSIMVETFLRDGCQNGSSSAEVFLSIARRLKGIPYVAHTLDRTDDERMVVNLRGLDCTTFIETAMAMTLCVKEGRKRFVDYVEKLRLIRYRQGIHAYENRLHYWQWWVEDNERMGFVKQIDDPNPPFTAVQTLKINYMSLHFLSYDMLRNHPERVAALKTIEDATNGKRVRYIPKESIANTKLMRETIHDGDIIAIVTQKKNLDTTHLGIAVWHKDGLHLLNASQIHKKVVEEPMTLYAYMQKHPSQIGIRIARML